MPKSLANGLCLLVALIWGGGFLATDAALATFLPLTILLLRFCIGALLAWIPCVFFKTRISRQALTTGMVSGLLLYLAFAFQTFGLQGSDTGMNAFLTAVNVVLVPYFSWIFFKKKPVSMVAWASLICLVGIGFLSFSSGQFQFRTGDWLTLVCAVLFALQITVLGRVSDENPLVVNAIQLTTAAVLSIPFSFLESWPASIGVQAWQSVAYSGVLATFVCYLLQTAAQKYTSPSEAGVLLCTESLWANLLGFLLCHDSKSWTCLLGGGLIFVSILMIEGRQLFCRHNRLPVTVEQLEK